MDPEVEERPTRNTPVLSIVAIVMSVGALLVSVFEVSAIRDEQRVQVWPYLSLSTNYSGEGFTLEAINKGIGPARVRTLELTYEGELVEDLDQLILETLGEEDAFSYELYRASDLSNSVLSPDEERIVFGVPWEPRTRRLVDIWISRIDLSACFCSVYDECWESRLNAGDPMPVASCKAN
ncbi:MAG: hypothetical protein AAF660_04950 [Pseudomonadota bacterium]